MEEYALVIIGGGPAGLTAGLYGVRYGLKTVMLEQGLFGGKIVNAKLVENYPGFPQGISGMDLGQQMFEQASRFGLKAENATVTGFAAGDALYEIATDDSSYLARSVIIAAGSSDRKLDVPGEADLTGRGVSYCATCDGFLFREKEVAVVGGGDTALSDALELAEHARGVHVIHRRDQLRGSEVLQKAALTNPKIKFIWNSAVQRVNGEQKVRSLTLKNVKTGADSTLEIDGVFVAVGAVPNSGVFRHLVKVDENGYILIDQSMRTNLPGVFAAGDVRSNSARQVSTAVGDGAAAARSCASYLRGT